MHIFELTQAPELYRAYQARIAECDREIEDQLERFEDRSDGEPPAPNGKKRNQKNAPRFDVQGQLYRMTGVDLTRIDGVDGFTALKVISEIGTDMTKWPSAQTSHNLMCHRSPPESNGRTRALNPVSIAASTLPAFLRSLDLPEPDELRRVARVYVWARWFVLSLATFAWLYPPTPPMRDIHRA